MPTITFSINLSAADYLPYYRGSVRNIVIQTHDGANVQFPAMWLRSYVTTSGIAGHFELCYDDNKRFISLKKLA